MEIGCIPIGGEDGHTAGRRLLQRMFEEKFSRPMPQILVTERGKPYFSGNPVYFSISHTKKRVFCVLADCPVGIDAEEQDREISLKLAEKILSEKEKLYFQNVPLTEEGLLRLWVLKEAAAKCTGEGLQGYPNHTDFTPEDPRVIQRDNCFVAVICDREQEKGKGEKYAV